MISFDDKKAIANLGDMTRFFGAFDRLEDGQDVTICFLGGSITQGSLSSAPETCYAYRVYSYFKEKFRKSNIKYVNAGVGGTTSVFGAARVDRDVLMADPDIVLLEFSVNDECNDYFLESYEGLVRKLLNARNKPAVAALFNFYYENGKTAERIHSRVARHYGIPAASMHGAIYEDILSGKLEDIGRLSPDGLHPNDKGHELVANVVINLFDRLYKEYKILRESEAGKAFAEDAKASEIKAPLTLNAFESARRLDNRDFMADLKGFTVDKAPQKGVSDCFKNGWLGKKMHDRIIFELNGEYDCSGIAIQYEKTIKRPAPVVAVTLDGKDDEKVMIDAAFEETWGDLLDIKQLFLHEKKGSHKLEIEIVDDKGGEAVAFNLVSIIITG